MSRFIFEQLEQLVKESKELSTPYVSQKWDADKQTYNKKLDLVCELPSLSQTEIARLRDDPAYFKNFKADSVMFSPARNILVIGSPNKQDREFPKLLLEAPGFNKLLLTDEKPELKVILGPIAYRQEVQGLF